MTDRQETTGIGRKRANPTPKLEEEGEERERNQTREAVSPSQTLPLTPHIRALHSRSLQASDPRTLEELAYGLCDRKLLNQENLRLFPFVPQRLGSRIWHHAK